MIGAPWTPEEDRRIVAARNLGMSWKQIADHYAPGRTVGGCSTRYEFLKAREQEDLLQEAAPVAYHPNAAQIGSAALLARQIKAGQVFPVTMTIWQARHGVPA